MKYSSRIAILFSAALLLAPWSPAFADGNEGAEASYLELTLDHAIRLALENNRKLLNARLDRTIDRLALTVAEDRYHPTATIGPSAHARRGGHATAEFAFETGVRIPTGGRLTLRWLKPIGDRDAASDSVTIGFSQPLLKGYGMDVDMAPLRVARLTEHIGALAYREAIASVVVSTIRSWRSLVRAQRQVEIGEASLARARKQLEISRALIEAGQMAAREILHSEANIAARELDLVQILNGVSAANFALIDILDIDSATVLRPIEVAARKRPRPKLEESIGTALRQSPGHARALLDKEIAAINLAVAESDTLWDLSLAAEATRGMGDGSERIDYSAGVRLTIPFWNRPAELGLMRAKADVRRAERILAEVRQSIGIAVRQAVHDVAVGQRRIELARRSRALAQEKLEIERSKVTQGLSSTFRLSQAEDDLVRTQNAELDAIIDYENALVALDETLGTTLDNWNIRIEQVG